MDRDRPVLLGWATWKEIRTLAGPTSCFFAMPRMISFVSKGDLSEPSGE
jgi:hypothetical protein